MRRAEFDRPDTRARSQVEDDELALAIRQDEVQYQAVFSGGHRLDPRSARDRDRVRRKRAPGGLADAAVRHPAGNDKNQRGKTGDEHDAHYHDHSL